MPGTSAPTTAVIGAGISGLTTTKMLADYGVPVTCFEASDRVGGNWAFGNPNGHSSAYQSLHIDTSKHQLSFKDFPMPDDYPDFPHHTEIKDYLDSYADAFGLREHIEFGNRVLSARRLEGGGWEIDDEAGATRRFDLLVVANGHHWDPRTAEFPGEFTGESFHSHHYVDPWTPLHLMDKRILVVGLGNSAADITVELSQRALRNQVTLSTRSSAWVVPKLMFGKAADMNYRTNPHLPLSWQRKVAQWGQRLTASDPTLYGLPAPNHKFFEAHPTQSGELPLRLKSGDVTPKGNVVRLDGSTVHFEDGTSSDFDVIIYATGYNLTFPFFDPEFISAPENRIDLYKRIFKPDIDDLLFAGFAQATPTLFPFVECQARVIAAYAVGAYAAAVGGRDARGDQGRRRALHGPHARPSAAHPPARLLRLRARHPHQGAPRRTSPGPERASSRRRHEPGRHARPTAAAEGRPATQRAPRVARPAPAGEQLRLDQHRRHLPAGGCHALGLLLLLREQGRGRGGPDGGAVRRDLRRLPWLTSTDSTPEVRITSMVTGLFGATRRHEHLFAAMLEARATSQAVREIGTPTCSRSSSPSPT